VIPKLDPHTTQVFQRALKALKAKRARFIVAGAFATNHHTGIWRNTKDLDVFCEPAWADRVIDILGDAGFDAYVVERHWLGKAEAEGCCVDAIWGGGNWCTFIDEHWFSHAEKGNILGEECLIAPAEDIILSKAWVAGRERYDGADICHLIHGKGPKFDWDDLLARFGDHWQLLLQYLVLYRFVYPDDRDLVPAKLIHDLAARIGTDAELADGLHFRGPLVDRYAYLHDLHEGLPDPRETVAARAGYPVAAVIRRRELDSHAFDLGTPYKHYAQQPSDDEISDSLDESREITSRVAEP
jgi:hypothetical protein